jgi:hypothetical protein
LCLRGGLFDPDHLVDSLGFPLVGPLGDVFISFSGGPFPLFDS